VGPAQVLTLQLSEDAMPSLDEPSDCGDMDALVERQQTGVASQLIAELVEGAQVSFHLRHIVGIVLEGPHDHGVVDVGDGYLVLLQVLPEEHILVAALCEPFVEGTLLERLPVDDEVRGAELLILVLLPLFCSMQGLGFLFVNVTEARAEAVIGTDADTSIDDTLMALLQIVAQEMFIGDMDVGIQKQHQPVLTVLCQEVAGGGTSRVVLLDDKPAMGQLVDDLIGLDARLVGRGVVGYDDLIVDVKLLGLPLQVLHLVHAYIIVTRDENG